jgi:hypothetical protein
LLGQLLLVGCTNQQHSVQLVQRQGQQTEPVAACFARSCIHLPSVYPLVCDSSVWGCSCMPVNTPVGSRWPGHQPGVLGHARGSRQGLGGDWAFFSSAATCSTQHMCWWMKLVSLLQMGRRLFVVCLYKCVCDSQLIEQPAGQHRHGRTDACRFVVQYMSRVCFVVCSMHALLGYLWGHAHHQGNLSTVRR